MRNAVRIDRSDNVATVLRDVSEREPIGWDEGSELAAREFIPEGHKVALVDIAEGEVVRKYGHPIGRAGREIPAGTHVHIHNLAKEEA
jgi:altronate hydrolase